MSYGDIIHVQDLKDHLEDPNWVIIDCRYSIAEPELGYQEYLEARAATKDAQTRVNKKVKTSQQQPEKQMKERLPDIEKVEAQIKFLESELEGINQAILACGDDYQQQKELGERYRKLETDLELLLQLWERAAQADGLA